MHILFVTGEYPPLRGGVGAYTEALARALQSLGVRTSVLTSGRGGARAGAGDPAVFCAVTRWGPGIWAQARSLAHELKADWIHVQYQTAAFGMNPAINFAPDRWRGRLRVAWTYHDLLVPYLFPKAGRALRTWVTERPAFAADQVIVTNEADRRQLEGRVSALEMIPIGSNIQGLALAPAERAAVRRRYGYGDAQALIGYFGFLNRSKGGLTLVRSLASLVARGVDAHLLMVGERVGASDPTNAAYLAEVEAQIDALGLAPRVRWTGHLDDGAAAAALNALDVLVLPFEDGASLRRGTLMAGLANGCAIVTTTPAAPLPELADGRDLLYVARGSAEACADAALLILQQPGVAAHLRENARARSSLFAWESIARRHAALYQAGAPHVSQ